MAKKVIVVGIDGASPNLLNEMFEQGLLPHLREIRQRGVSGTLLSTHHPITPAAWTSIITGLGPGMHGLFDFRRRVCGSFDVKVLKGKDRDGETIWHLLVEAGYSVGVWNVPMTFPPERVRGFWVSGMDTPDQKLCFTYPSFLTTWLDRRTGGYLIDVGQGASTEEEYVEEILHLQRIHRQAFESLLQRYQPDACLGVFTTTDRIQHAFWKYLDPEQEAYHSPRAAVFRESVRKCYEDIDDFLGFLLEEYVGKQGAVLIVVSDHGFGPLYKDVYLNQWLADQGYLKLRDRGGAWEGVSLFERIDWERTIAYSFGYFGSLYLNLQGREPLGVVKPGREQRQILTRLKKELEQLQLPEGDGPLVDGLYELQELYSGPYVELGPDLLVVMQNYALMSRDTFDVPRGVLFSEPMAYQHIAIKHSGNHRMEGIIFMIGEGIAEGQYLPNASVLDVAPTVLYLMGLPIPVYMEGRVLTEALEPGSPEVQYVERRMVSKAPTLHRLASQVYLLQAIRERQSHLIAEQRRQLKWWRSLWPVRLMRWVKRVLRIK